MQLDWPLLLIWLFSSKSYLSGSQQLSLRFINKLQTGCQKLNWREASSVNQLTHLQRVRHHWQMRHEVEAISEPLKVIGTIIYVKETVAAASQNEEWKESWSRRREAGETVKSQKLSHWGEIVHLVSNEAVKSLTNILSPHTKTSENMAAYHANIKKAFFLLLIIAQGSRVRSTVRINEGATIRCQRNNKFKHI